MKWNMYSPMGMGVYSSQSQQMMQKMGHRFGQGLGKYSQGCTSLIPVTSKEPTRKGLGFFLGATGKALPITWKSEDPVWVPQWPLPSEKLWTIHELVQEQLSMGHIQASTSPWNTPIFVIKKKSGKWRLLQDLRAINKQMMPMGPVQRGLPLPSTLPKQWPLIVIDIKDCFFFYSTL